jgi:signal peptidase II
MLGFQAGHIILIIISILGTLLLGYALYKFRNSMNKWELLGIVLALAGCVGNLIDRVIYIDGQPRGVIDFIHFYIEKINFDWPVFNVADMLLVVGIILFAIFYLVEESKKEKQKKQALELLEKQKKEELNQGDENGK